MKRNNLRTSDSEGQQQKRKYNPSEIHAFDTAVEIISKTTKNTTPSMQKDKNKKYKKGINIIKVHDELPDLNRPKFVNSSKTCATSMETKTVFTDNNDGFDNEEQQSKFNNYEIPDTYSDIEVISLGSDKDSVASSSEETTERVTAPRKPVMRQHGILNRRNFMALWFLIDYLRLYVPLKNFALLSALLP
jgi:hypothetical protein